MNPQLKLTLPRSVLFSDRKKSNLNQALKNLPEKSAVIIREYDLTTKKRKELIEKIHTKHKLIIGKDFNLARKLKADGIHFSDRDKLPIKLLKQGTFPKNTITSFACHSYKSLIKATKLKLFDIIFISPIFPTTSHKNTLNIGRLKLAKMLNKNNLAKKNNIYALGGINKQNFQSLKKIGVKGFGAIDFFNY